MELKGIYQIDNEQTLEIEEDDLDASDSYITNKGYEKMQVNFVGIESIYNCITCFYSYFALHRHIKTRCDALERTALV